MDERLHRMAVRQGYLTRGQIVDGGYRDRDIKAALRAGVLTRLRHGIYAYSKDIAGLSDVARHKLLSYAVIDRLGAGFVLSHQSAAAVYGVERFGLPDGDVHVTREDERAGRREAGVVHHVGKMSPDDITIVDGRPVVRAARAVFETASISNAESGIVTASSALRLGLVSPLELAEMAARMCRWQGARRASLVFRLADGRCDTVGESRSLFMMWKGGVPRPEQQVEIRCRGGVPAWVDYDWDAWCHTGEFDGLVKYGRLNPYATDVGRVLTDEKMREDAVRGTNRGMSRWIWSELDARRALTTAERLLADLELSRRIYKRSRSYFTLT